MIATKMSVEEYLHGDHGWDAAAEYVDGEIEERPLGEKNHSKWQLALQVWFWLHREQWHLTAYPELRSQTREASYRLPDVLVLADDAPDEQIVRCPPAAVFEILSPEDRLERVERKLREYEAMGVKSIYLVDPDTGRFQRFQSGILQPVVECEVGAVRFQSSDIAALLP